MSDLISRQAVNEVLYDLGLGDEENGGDPEYMSALHDCKEFIDQIPSADVRENIHGEWIKIQSGDKNFPESIVCSACGGENSYLDFGIGTEPIAKSFVKSKYCPNCGTDMRKTETCNGCTHPCVMYEPTMKACEKKGREI